MFTVEYRIINDYVGEIKHKDFADFACAMDYFYSLAFDSEIELAEVYKDRGLAGYILLDSFITSGEVVR